MVHVCASVFDKSLIGFRYVEQNVFNGTHTHAQSVFAELLWFAAVYIYYLYAFRSKYALCTFILSMLSGPLQTYMSRTNENVSSKLVIIHDFMAFRFLATFFHPVLLNMPWSVGPWAIFVPPICFSIGWYGFHTAVFRTQSCSLTKTANRC